MTYALETQIRGEGSPVLLLHSGGMSSRQWKKLAEALAPSYRVVLPDFLGSGANPVWPAGEPFTFGLDVDAVEAILQRLGEPVHIFGHSYGGFIAMKLAERNPTLVRSLAAFDPVAFGVLFDANDEAGIASLISVSTPRFTDESTGGDDAWFELFVDYWNGAGTWGGMPASGRDGFLKVGRKVFFEVMTLVADRMPRSAYLLITAPALFMTGERSPAAGRRVAEILAETLPRGRVESIAGSGHMGPITHANAVNALIVEHLARA